MLTLVICFFGIIASVFYLNVSKEYPTEEACSIIRNFHSINKRLPSPGELDSIQVPTVKFFSVREYRVNNGDFLFYYCPTVLGPCEVCTLKEGPFFDEV